MGLRNWYLGFVYGVGRGMRSWDLRCYGVGRFCCLYEISLGNAMREILYLKTLEAFAARKRKTWMLDIGGMYWIYET